MRQWNGSPTPFERTKPARATSRATAVPFVRELRELGVGFLGLEGRPELAIPVEQSHEEVRGKVRDFRQRAPVELDDELLRCVVDGQVLDGRVERDRVLEEAVRDGRATTTLGS
jgi:hypothetical protein